MIQAGLQAVVVAVAGCIGVFDEAEVRIRHLGGYAVHDERLVEVDQVIEMRGFGSHIVHVRSPGVRELSLETEAPLLYLRRWTVRIHRTHMVRLQLIQIDIGWIEITIRKSL